MLIKNLFERDIFRPINGVVKADQLDDSSVWQELDEFVITQELDLFASRYANHIEHVYVDHRPLSEEIRSANEVLANRITSALNR